MIAMVQMTLGSAKVFLEDPGAHMEHSSSFVPHLSFQMVVSRERHTEATHPGTMYKSTPSTADIRRPHQLSITSHVLAQSHSRSSLCVGGHYKFCTCPDSPRCRRSKVLGCRG